VKISIITAVLNRKEFIRAAIESVLAQDYSDFEHWIIDGGSSDGTLELLKQYSHLRLLSEPDRGVFAARNSWRSFLPHKLSRVVARYFEMDLAASK
jgi:glycosyltransferase involved in cell wall biosynthesis